MKNRTSLLAVSLLAALVGGLVALPRASAQDAAPDAPGDAARDEALEPTVVFLVRHAEKQSGGADPELSEAGVERAAELAAVLRDARIEGVHTTDYVRTRETARPVAAALGVELQLYDPRDLRGLVDALAAAGGRHLVVGHSNTTPAAVELLGGEPGAAIEEASEYDRLYVVTRAADASVSTALLRYGAH